MSEELEVLKVVAQRLAAAGLAYMVTGSVAMNHYAVPRMTRDIDLVVELAAMDADRLCDLFEADFYVDRQAVRHAVETRTVFNMIHTALVVQLADVRNLNESVTDLDREYLAEWTERLGLDALYREATG